MQDTTPDNSFPAGFQTSEVAAETTGAQPPKPASELATLLIANESWLMRQVRDYALARGYTRYTSTLKEAWRVSIVGLNDTILAALARSDEPWELGPDDDYAADPVAAFGILEARKHRARGVTLGMFLGLMKYYRQSYLDLIRQSLPAAPATNDTSGAACCALFVERIFDRIEIGFCSEWNRSETADNAIRELQASNRKITNEKNRFLTIFESLPTAVFLLDEKNIIIHVNQAGARLVASSDTPGSHYYSCADKPIPFPWLGEELARYRAAGEADNLEFQITRADGEKRQVKVRLRQMQDVSGKFPGTLVIFEDITDLKRIENELIATRDALRDQVSHDALTGLLNRREILNILERQLSRSKREGTAISVIMADLDHFKKVNDTHGHLVGDEVLRQTAQRMLASARDYDSVGRYGGEEFILVLPGCDRASAAAFAERLRCCIAEKEMLIPGGEIPLTISLGVATGGKGHAENATAIIEAADQALYRAKRNGRNRVEPAP